MSQPIEKSDERQGAEFSNVWLHLRRGEYRPAVDLFRMLERNRCMAAARGFLHDLAERIVEAPSRMGSAADANQFIEAAKFALSECVQNDRDAFERYMRAALRRETPRFGDLFRFRLVHVFVLTAVCAVAVSFFASLTAVFALIYLCVLVLVLPLYAGSLYRAYRGDTRSAKNALLISVTILLVFLFAMTQAEIRSFYPLTFWGIPPALVLAAAYIVQIERRRVLSPQIDRNALPSE